MIKIIKRKRVNSIELQDLIGIIPELINLFLSGFIFMEIYNWLTNRNMDISVIVLWSLFVNTLIVIFYSAVHSFIFVSYDFHEAVKILIYILTGCILPFVIVYVQKSKLLKEILYRTNNKSINSDIFEDIIDYDKTTMMKVYIKGSDVYYIGAFKYREEKGLDSYIVLINYASLNKETVKTVFKPSKEGVKSVAAINLQDIERIEIIYDDESEVWKNMNKPQESQKE